MSCLCTPASFTIIIYLFVNISQPGNNLREVAPGHRLLPHAPLGLHKVEERAAGEVFQDMAVETASGYHLKQPIPLGWCRSFWIACSSQASPTCCSGMRFINKLVDFPAVVKLACEIFSMFELENFFTDYILFLGQFCDESNESRYKNGRVWIANGHLIESSLSLL